jgi:hypothetical protein
MSTPITRAAGRRERQPITWLATRGRWTLVRRILNERFVMKKLLLALAFSSSAHAGSDVAVYFDPNRNLNIFEVSHFHKVTDKIDIYGFNEVYKNNNLGFPQEKIVWFGKTWAMYNLNKDLSIGLEIEHGVNNAGMFTTSRPFQQDRFFLLPKVGIKYKLY